MKLRAVFVVVAVAVAVALVLAVAAPFAKADDAFLDARASQCTIHGQQFACQYAVANCCQDAAFCCDAGKGFNCVGGTKPRCVRARSNADGGAGGNAATSPLSAAAQDREKREGDRLKQNQGKPPGQASGGTSTTSGNAGLSSGKASAGGMAQGGAAMPSQAQKMDLSSKFSPALTSEQTDAESKDFKDVLGETLPSAGDRPSGESEASSSDDNPFQQIMVVMQNVNKNTDVEAIASGDSASGSESESDESPSGSAAQESSTSAAASAAAASASGTF